MKNERIGLGFDLHRITKEKESLILGGFKIGCGFGLQAVSDGDVVLHAVADAICGAACLGDIGDYFPPEDEKNKGIDSRKIANTVLEKIKNKYRLINIDITLVAEKPKLSPFKPQIINSLKSIFQIKEINLKIKSKEATQVLGSVNTISSLAVALIAKVE